MPAEVIPPMYDMTLDELSAEDDDKPFSCTHYLLLSKTYQEVESNLDQESGKMHKRKKQKSGANSKTGSSMFYFHPEDEVLQRHAQLYGGFDYLREQEGQSDSRRAFQDLGIRPRGHLILIESEKLSPAVAAVKQYISQA